MFRTVLETTRTLFVWLVGPSACVCCRQLTPVVCTSESGASMQVTATKHHSHHSRTIIMECNHTSGGPAAVLHSAGLRQAGRIVVPLLSHPGCWVSIKHFHADSALTICEVMYPPHIAKQPLRCIPV